MEVLLDITPDDENDLPETGGDRIMNAVVNDQMPVCVHRFELFDASPETGSDSGCENYKCFRHVCFFPSFLLLPLFGFE
jgi:hypothetical protein